MANGAYDVTTALSRLCHDCSEGEVRLLTNSSLLTKVSGFPNIRNKRRHLTLKLWRSPSSATPTEPSRSLSDSLPIFARVSSSSRMNTPRALIEQVKSPLERTRDSAEARARDCESLPNSSRSWVQPGQRTPIALEREERTSSGDLNFWPICQLCFKPSSPKVSYTARF